MSSNYIGTNGIVTQDLEEILEDLQAKFKNIYGQNINLEQNTSDSQWLNILAQEKKDILDLAVTFYNNLDPDRAIGIPQQILYKLNGIFIKAFSYSYVYVDVTTTGAVTLQGLDDDIENADGTGYTVTDTNGVRWILAETATITGAGTYRLNFRAANLGNVASLANTITIMETIIGGVQSINNPANNYITGDTGETSAEFRQRRNKEMSLPSQGFKESLEAQLLNLDNVTQARVYENKKDVEENNIPPHTVWAIVEGGKSADIGQTLANNIPPGIPMKGEQSVNVEQLNGRYEIVYYDLPQSANLYVKATLQNFSSSSINTDYIKKQLAQNNYEIGERADSANITAQIKELLGDTGTVYDLLLSGDGSTWVEFLTPAGLDEFFVLLQDNITLTVEGLNG